MVMYFTLNPKLKKNTIIANFYTLYISLGQGLYKYNGKDI